MTKFFAILLPIITTSCVSIYYNDPADRFICEDVYIHNQNLRNDLINKDDESSAD